MKTYETKIKDGSSAEFIRQMNQSFGHMSRKLFVKLYASPTEDRNKLKRDFNPLRAFPQPLEMEGKSSHQLTAIFGNHIRDIVLYAKFKGKPIAVGHSTQQGCSAGDKLLK